MDGRGGCYACVEVIIMFKNKEILEDYPREYWENIIDQWAKDEKAKYALKRNLLDRASYETIAEELGVSVGTVYNKMAKYAPLVFEHSD